MGVLTAGVVFVLGYAAIASDRFDRVKVVLIGAGLLLGLRVLDLHGAFHDDTTGVDWSVILLLFGMMVIVGALQHTGLFEYLSLRAVIATGGRPFALMVLLAALTAVASALIDNVTTVLLVCPMIISLTRELRLPATPYLLAMVFASNIGGTATLIGDPPNIIIGSEGDLSYTDFLVNLAPLVVILFGVLLLLCRVMFRSALTRAPEPVQDLDRATARGRLTDPRLLRWSLAVLGVSTVAFALHGVLHYEPAVIALLGAGVMLLVAKQPTDLLHEVEWGTLAFFVGLFIMVGALVEVGIVSSTAERLAEVVDGRLLLGSMVLLFASALLSAIIDNIPYVATMAPIVSALAEDAPNGSDPTVLWWSLALGADLGGNATPVGASANLIVLAIAARHGHEIGFGRFVGYGAVVSLATLLVSAAYLYLRYFALA